MLNLKMPSLGPFNKPIRLIRRQLPPINFITLHYLYFIATSLVSALILWGSSTPFRSVSFLDSLFLTISAMTGAGLNSVNLSELNTFQQVILFLLIIFGSAILISAFVVHIRWKAFVVKFVDVKEQQRRARARGKMKTWATIAMKGKARDTLGDEEAGAKDVATEKKTSVSESDENSARRDETPPGRRGAPEMNGISSTTGERLDDESGTLSPISPSQSRLPGITFRDDTQFAQPKTTGLAWPMPRTIQRRRTGLFAMNGVGARPMASLPTNTSLEFSSLPPLQRPETSVDAITKARRDISMYLDSAQGWISRNSQFYGLTQEEREQLGGVEYRAVSLLAWLVPLYFVLWQLFGAIGSAAYIASNRPAVAADYAVNAWWAGAFNAVSAFNNCGMSLIDANMVPFQRNYYILLTTGILVLAGNTCYAIFLRIIVWVMYKFVERVAQNKPPDDSWQERMKTLRFLLDHPRRCYTTLFPSQHTWWLALTVFTLNGIDWVMFQLLNIGNDQLEEGLATRYRVIDSLFQTLAVRGGGFYVFTISALRISLLVLYIIMMYISVYPVVITMRNSNVYEERSLGIYAEEDSTEKERAEEKGNPQNGEANGIGSGLLRRAQTMKDAMTPTRNVGSAAQKNGHFVREQLRAQLAHDIWWVVLAIWLIMIVEADHFEKNPAVFSVFTYLFEIVSAYSCVGMSIGVPWAEYSFSGAWHPLSRLILCAVMLRGRHRGLPVAIDKAVLLPSEIQGMAEEEDGRIRLAKTLTRARLEAGEV